MRRLTSLISQHATLRCGPPLRLVSRHIRDADDDLEVAIRGEEPAACVPAHEPARRGHAVVSTDSAATRLAQLAGMEIAHETLRDEQDGIAALPPLIPAGWIMQHQPGTNFLTMHRTKNFRLPRPRLQDANGDDVHFTRPPQKNRPSSAARGDGDAGSRAGVKNDSDVTLFCPFRFKDPSFHDLSVDLCEWLPFDCLVTKKRAGSSSLFLRLASVNSELRIRSAQLITAAAVDAIGPDVMSITPRGEPSSAASGQLRSPLRFGVQGDYLRSLLYGGPAVVETSQELRDELLNYVSGPDVGVTAEVVEYVCQMVFFSEQEEYMRWLGRLREFASPPIGPAGAGNHVRRGLP